MAKIQGMGIALITPFKADFSVDYEALRHLVEFQVSAGADFLAVLCTTAETPTLTAEERAEVRRVVTETVRGRVPIVLGCGG
ncbi:MAG: dihydrodipicolinate synthase family protein, partial [Bacteroidales bacterium]|nr:dihydrodipicolinate synthase family protein [Bacteroidales bacterium]